MQLQPITQQALKALRRDLGDMILCEGATPEQINAMRIELLKAFDMAADDVLAQKEQDETEELFESIDRASIYKLTAPQYQVHDGELNAVVHDKIGLTPIS